MSKDAQAISRVRRHEVGHPLRTQLRDEIVPQQLPRIVRAQVPRHHLLPDDDVGAGPGLGREAEEEEFGRQRGPFGEKRVHPGDVGVRVSFRAFRQPVPGGARRAAEPYCAKKTILWDSRRAEDLGETTVADAALKLHLPEAILRVDVAQAEERVTFLVREDVRNRVAIADDRYRGGDARHGHVAGHHRQRAPKQCVGADGQDDQERSDRRHGFEHNSAHVRITIPCGSRLAHRLSPN